MIIDVILDRRDDIKHGRDNYNARRFYADCIRYGNVGDGITRAMDCGTEHDVKRELIRYIIENNYSMDVIDFILSVWWIDQQKHNSIAEYIKENKVEQRRE